MNHPLTLAPTGPIVRDATGHDTTTAHDRLTALVRAMADVVTRYGSLTVHEGSELHTRMVELTGGVGPIAERQPAADPFEDQAERVRRLRQEAVAG